MKFAIILALFAVAAFASKKVYFCEVPVTVDDSVSNTGLNLGSAGTFGWENFNAIAFDSYAGDSTGGDVEGRLAVRNNYNANAYTIGHEIYSTGVNALDKHLPVSLVVGGDASVKGGSVEPDGTTTPHPAQREGFFVGGTFTSSKFDASSRVTTPVKADVQSSFDNAQTYFAALQAAFGAMSNNGQWTLQYSTITITCSAQVTVVTASIADMKKATEIVAPSCADKSLIINVPAGADFAFHGNMEFHKAESLVWNIMGSGRLITLQTTVQGGVLAPFNTIKHTDSLNIGYIVAANFKNMNQINRVHCVPPKEPETPYKCVEWEDGCTGTTNSVFSFTDFNVISFGDFKADTGDIEGRLVAAGNCEFGNGYSVGAVLSTVNDIPDRSVSYSLICGGDLTWGNGALYPDGTNYLAPGNQENAYVVGTSTVPDHLADRVVKGSDLTAAFASAKSCYTGFSDKLANLPSNTKYVSENTGITVTCDGDATRYVLNVDGADLSASRYYVTSGCTWGSEWIINVVGSGSVELTGDTFPSVPGGTIYNIVGCGRTVSVHDVNLGGHLLAPCSTLNQASGVITGKVVAGSVTFSLQINRENTCPDASLITKSVVCSAAGSGFTVSIAGANEFRVKDVTSVGTITAIDGSRVTFDRYVSCAAGQNIGSAKIASDANRYQYPNEQSSSASSVAVATAVVAAAALML